MAGERKAVETLAKAVIAGAVVFACYWLYTRNFKQDKKDQPAEQPEKFSQKSKKDVKAILEEVVSVQKTMMKIMDETIDELVHEKLSSLEDVYKKIEAAQVEDPLERNGLTIADFDELLVRFSQDEEVNHLVNEVVQGPDAQQMEDRLSLAEIKRSSDELTVERVITLNQAMRSCLKDVIDDIQRLKPKTPNFSPKVASLTVQAMVGAYIKREFEVSADELERAMMLHQYELSQRSEFLMVNEEITNLMNTLRW